MTLVVPPPGPCLFFSQSTCFAVVKCCFLKFLFGVFRSKIHSRGIVWGHGWPYRTAQKTVLTGIRVARMKMTKSHPCPHTSTPARCVWYVCCETRSQGLGLKILLQSPQSSSLHLLNSKLEGMHHSTYRLHAVFSKSCQILKVWS